MDTGNNAVTDSRLQKGPPMCEVLPGFHTTAIDGQRERRWSDKFTSSTTGSVYTTTTSGSRRGSGTASATSTRPKKRTCSSISFARFHAQVSSSEMLLRSRRFLRQGQLQNFTKLHLTARLSQALDCRVPQP